MKKKAYMTFSGDREYGCLLVFAETPNKARSLSVNYLFEWEYVDISAHRKPAYDKFVDMVGSIVETNDDLPDGAPSFYDDNVF